MTCLVFNDATTYYKQVAESAKYDRPVCRFKKFQYKGVPNYLN